MRVLLLEAYRPRLRRLGKAAKSDPNVFNALRRAAARRTIRRQKQRAAGLEQKMAFKTSQEIRSLKIHRSHSEKRGRRAADLLRALHRRKHERQWQEDEKLKQKKTIPARIRKAARVIHKFGMKKGYFPNL